MCLRLFLCLYMCLRRTVRTPPMQRHVSDIDGETCDLFHRSSQGRRVVTIELTDVAAIPAYQVNVVIMAGELITRSAMVQVGVGYQTNVFQRLKASINRGRREVRAIGGKLRLNLIRGGMPQAADNVEHLLALPSQTHALSTQPLAKVTHGPNSRLQHGSTQPVGGHGMGSPSQDDGCHLH